jgi:hypothetical protein
LYREARPSSLDFATESNPREFIISTIDDWFERNRSTMNILNGKLIENEDFKIFLGPNESATLLCSCGVRINLKKDRSTFSLSNFYKHIKSKRCIMMKKKKSASQNDSQDMDSSGVHDLDEDESSQTPSATNFVLSSASTSASAITVNTPESLKRVGSSGSTISRKIQRVQR